jgi:hypothetical protein
MGFVPSGQPDGLYIVSYDGDQETHTLLKSLDDNLNTTKPDETAGVKLLQGRQIGGGSNSIQCHGRVLDMGDTDTANGEIDAYCGGGTVIPGGSKLYANVGCTISYFNNYNGGDDICFASERQAVAISINANCGGYGAGLDEFTSSSRHMAYGWDNTCD